MNYELLEDENFSLMFLLQENIHYKTSQSMDEWIGDVKKWMQTEDGIKAFALAKQESDKMIQRLIDAHKIDPRRLIEPMTI